jgi:hypothetical protein
VIEKEVEDSISETGTIEEEGSDLENTGSIITEDGF